MVVTLTHDQYSCFLADFVRCDTDGDGSITLPEVPAPICLRTVPFDCLWLCVRLALRRTHTVSGAPLSALR